MQLTPEQIDGSFAAMQDLFRQVRSLLLQNAGKVARNDKEDGTPVTEFDGQIEKMIIDKLAQDFPGMPVLGEETGYEDAHTGSAWLLDPIDGTKSFIENTPAFTNMAVLIQNDVAVASIIYNPAADTMYTARKGQGAYKNGERLDLHTVPLPQIAYCRERMIDDVNKITQPVGVACEPGPTGAGYGFSMVAEGTVAARFNFPHQPGSGYVHDYAPGMLLVQEAGGAVIPIDSDTLTYQSKSFVACHPELEALVRQQAAHIHDIELQTLQQ